MCSIIESHIGSFFKKLFQKVTLPSISIKTSNEAFSSLMMLVGLYASIHCVCKLARKAVCSLPLSLPTLEKYGLRSWAFVCSTDRTGLQYCKLLAGLGFNILFLAPDEDEVAIVRDILTHYPQIQVKHIFMELSLMEMNLQVFEVLFEETRFLDISIVVLPQVNEDHYRHIYSLARTFLPKLINRSYASALIFPSQEEREPIMEGVDCLGRVLGYEMNNKVKVIVARGSAVNALKGLSAHPSVTH